MRHIHLILILQLLMLLALANGTPLIAKKIFGTAFAHPLDKGVTLADGQPLFGHSKTIRGIVLSIGRGRDDHYWSPPAQIPACGATAPGSYLGCVTRNRCSGHGWRMRGYGR
jgi:hypothetical protein